MPFLPLPPIASAPAVAPPQKASREISVPDGWRRLSMKDGQIGFAPEDVPKGGIIGIVIWPEETASGDLQAWFKKKAVALGASGGKFQEAGGIVLTNGVNNSRPFILAAVRPKGSTTLARVAMIFGDSDLLQEHGDAFKEIVLGIRDGAQSSEAETSRSSRSGTKRKSYEEEQWENLPASDMNKPLPAADPHGAKIFIIYTNNYGLNGPEVRTDPLVLFPDGTAFDGSPMRPVAVFDSAHLKSAYQPGDTGRWSISGDKMTLTFPTRKPHSTTVYRKIGDSWSEKPGAKPTDAWNVYRRVVPVTSAKMQGEWRTKSLFTSGAMGGGAPMVASGSSGTLVFRGGRYADDTTRFASVTTANMGDAFKTGGDVGVNSNGKEAGGGRYRIDGLLLTRERFGKRGIEIAFLMPYFDGDKMGTMMIGAHRYTRPEK